MDTKCCFVHGCRHADSHITSYHTCGKCKGYGHGVVECFMNNNMNSDKINKLCENHIKNNVIALPVIKACTIADCKNKQTHTTESHQTIFSYSNMGIKGPIGTDQIFYYAYVEGNKLVKNCKNSFVKMSVGMDNYDVYINDHGIIKKETASSSSQADKIVKTYLQMGFKQLYECQDKRKPEYEFSF